MQFLVKHGYSTKSLEIPLSNILKSNHILLCMGLLKCGFPEERVEKSNMLSYILFISS